MFNHCYYSDPFHCCSTFPWGFYLTIFLGLAGKGYRWMWLFFVSFFFLKRTCQFYLALWTAIEQRLHNSRDCLHGTLNLSKTTQPASGGARIWTQVPWLQGPLATTRTIEMPWDTNATGCPTKYCLLESAVSPNFILIWKPFQGTLWLPADECPTKRWISCHMLGPSDPPIKHHSPQPYGIGSGTTF